MAYNVLIIVHHRTFVSNYFDTEMNFYLKRSNQYPNSLP